MLLFAASSSIWALPIPPFDAAIVAGYLGAMLALGVWVGRGQKTTVDYFLGGRSLPGWAVLLSIVSTETSAVTFLSIPGMAFATGGDLRFLQITFGYIVGRLVVVWLLLPLYFRGEPFTAYEVLERRFGKSSRRITSLLFLVTRNIADALRLYLAALVLQEAMGLEMQLCIWAVGAVTIAYTYLGGVRSVVWNDCVQFAVYIFGAGVILYKILTLLPGGTEEYWSYATTHGKLRIFDFTPSLTIPLTFWGGLIGGMFLTAATHGTDQLTVQRLLAAKSQKTAGWALAASGFIVCFQFALFLLIGVGLAAFYNSFPPEVPFGVNANDRVVAHFIINHLDPGIVGLTLAAVFAAAFSSSLNSLSTALVSDIVLPLSRHTLSREAQMRWAKWSTFAFGILQIGIAVAAYRLNASQSIVNEVLTIAAFTSGPMLGLYLIGVLAPSVSEKPALGGFACGLIVISLVTFLPKAWPQIPTVWWPWYATIGSAATFASGWLLNKTPLGAPSVQKN
jgi:solute:Na+ symporter, SSS family